MNSWLKRSLRNFLFANLDTAELQIKWVLRIKRIRYPFPTKEKRIFVEVGQSYMKIGLVTLRYTREHPQFLTNRESTRALLNSVFTVLCFENDRNAVYNAGAFEILSLPVTASTRVNWKSSFLEIHIIWKWQGGTSTVNSTFSFQFAYVFQSPL